MNKLATRIAEVDEELDEAVDLLGLFESYDERRTAELAVGEVLRVTRFAVEKIRAAQHVLAMIREEAAR